MATPKYTYQGFNVTELFNGGTNTNNDNTVFKGYPSGTTTNYNGEITAVPGYNTATNTNYTQSKKFCAYYKEYLYNGNQVTTPIPNWCNRIGFAMIGGGAGGGGGGGGLENDGGNNSNYNSGGGGGGGGAGGFYSSNIAVGLNKTLYINVGGGGSAGSAGNPGISTAGQGGANGGGSGGGGGATNINYAGQSYQVYGGSPGNGGGPAIAQGIANVGSGGVGGSPNYLDASGNDGNYATPGSDGNNSPNLVPGGNLGFFQNMFYNPNYSPLPTAPIYIGNNNVNNAVIYGYGGQGGQGGQGWPPNQNPKLYANNGTSGQSGYARLYFFPS